MPSIIHELCAYNHLWLLVHCRGCLPLIGRRAPANLAGLGPGLNVGAECALCRADSTGAVAGVFLSPLSSPVAPPPDALLHQRHVTSGVAVLAFEVA